MIQLTYDSHSTFNKAWLTAFEQKQVAYAVATSVNTIATSAQKRIVGLMSDVFDRPTPYTLRSTYVRYVKGAKVMAGDTAEIGLKDTWGGATPASQFMHPEIYGGARNQKRSERLFAFQGILRPSQAVAPGGGARMDSYGNVSRGQLQQVMSAVRAQGDPYTNSSRTARRASTRRNAARYFAGRPHGGAYAIYERVGRERLRVIFNVIDKPSYRKRLPFEETIRDEYVKKFDRLFDTYMAFAIQRT